MKTIGQVGLGFLIGFILLFSYGVTLKGDDGVQNAINMTKARLSASLQDPSSLEIDTMAIYRNAGGFIASCGTLRARNGFGGVRRAAFVVFPEAPNRALIGDRLPDKSFVECSGDLLYIKH